MLQLLIVSSSKVVADAVSTSVGVRYPDVPIHVSRIGDGERLKKFNSVVEDIEQVLDHADVVHDRFVGVVDMPQAEGIGAIHALSSVEGNLILAFPEVLWVPLYRDAKLFDVEDVPGQPRTMTLERAIRLCRAGYSPLFDGDGLRQKLMTSNGKLQDYVRKDIAVAIDEEASFTAINSYTAYRFGYRAFPITTGACADELLSGDWRRFPVSRGLKLDEGEGWRPAVVAFEDVCLEFPDKNVGYSRQTEFGERRDAAYKLLRDCDLRVITTAAQKGEKFADKSTGGVTVGRYFARQNAGGGKRSVNYSAQCGGFWGRVRNRLVRTWFNVSRGGWWGYWLVNLVDFCIMAGIALFVFFNWKLWVIPAIFVLFAVRWGIRVWHAKVALEYAQHLPLWSRFLLCHAQWTFMPLKFRNYFPLTRLHTHARTYWEMANKPLAGIFGLRNKCGLPNGAGFKGVDDAARIESLYANAKRSGRFAYRKDGDDHNSHSAPGMAMEIANRLLRRAERFRDQVRDAEGAVYGAVLATVASELLDFKTPALSIDALKLKHYFEVLAECEFIGVRTHIDISDRYIDIHNSMRRICGSETGVVRRDVFNCGMAEIVDALMNLLREKGRLEEAVYMTHKSRFLHRMIMPPFARMFLMYPEWAMRSASHFIASFAGFFAITYVFIWTHRHLLVKSASDNALIINSVWDNLCETFCIMVANQPTMPFDADLTLYATVQLLRMIAIMHMTFLGVRFWDFMHRK